MYTQHYNFETELYYNVTICSCLRVLLNMLESLHRPDVNAGLHEFGLQVKPLLSKAFMYKH